MFNDRDLFLIGAGALLAVFCLLLPFSFALKVVCGLALFIVFMAAALMRFGPDRVPLEEWLKRKIGYHLRARKYTYQRPGYRPPPVERPRTPPQPPPQPQPAQLAAAPVSFEIEGDRIYHLAGALLVVVGLYFIAWLSQGGAAAIARDLDLIFQGAIP